jgi:hypothetical protein
VKEAEWRRLVLRWWESKRPESWTETDHLMSPKIGCDTPEEIRMAMSAARWVKIKTGKAGAR